MGYRKKQKERIYSFSQSDAQNNHTGHWRHIKLPKNLRLRCKTQYTKCFFSYSSKAKHGTGPRIKELEEVKVHSETKK